MCSNCKDLEAEFEYYKNMSAYCLCQLFSTLDLHCEALKVVRHEFMLEYKKAVANVFPQQLSMPLTKQFVEAESMEQLADCFEGIKKYEDDDSSEILIYYECIIRDLFLKFHSKIDFAIKTDFPPQQEPDQLQRANDEIAKFKKQLEEAQRTIYTYQLALENIENIILRFN